MPPFRVDLVPFIDVGGRVWVERLGPVPGEPMVYGVFDHAGILVQRVRAPAGATMLGADERWLYGARADDDGLWHAVAFPVADGGG